MNPAAAKIRKLDREHRAGRSGIDHEGYLWLRSALARDGRVHPGPPVRRPHARAGT